MKQKMILMIKLDYELKFKILKNIKRYFTMFKNR